MTITYTAGHVSNISYCLKMLKKLDCSNSNSKKEKRINYVDTKRQLCNVSL